MEFSEVRLRVFSEVRTVMLPSMQRPTGITWLVAPGLAMIAVTYGLARWATLYGGCRWRGCGCWHGDSRQCSYGLGPGTRGTDRRQQQWTRLTAHGRGGWFGFTPNPPKQGQR